MTLTHQKETVYDVLSLSTYHIAERDSKNYTKGQITGPYKKKK
jgi:hypothetical protein